MESQPACAAEYSVLCLCFAKALLPTRTAVPTSPSGNIIRQALSRDVAQRLINPGMGLCVQRRIVSKAEKRWNCAVALLLCKHARLRQAARRALPHQGRGIVVQSLQKRRNRIIRSQIGQSFNRSEEHTSELQSRLHLVCRLLLEKKKKKINRRSPTSEY